MLDHEVRDWTFTRAPEEWSGLTSATARMIDEAGERPWIGRAGDLVLFDVFHAEEYRHA